MTDDLAAFLRARLDEDETTVAAAEAFDAWWPAHAVRHNSRSPVAAREAFMAGWDASRARALREAAAKRAILDGYEVTRQRYDSREEMGDLAADRHRAGEVFGLKFAVQVLGAVYSDHPDYRQEWAP